MTKEEIKQALGEFYINSSEKSKDVYIDVINRFINKNPKFKPIIDINLHRSYFSTYCKLNELQILEDYFFLQKIPYTIKGGHNDICVAVDKNNVKRVLLKRGVYAEAKEMTRSLALNTLKDLYKCLVYEIIDPLKIYREIKDVQSIVANFKEGTIIKQCFESNGDIHYHFIKSLKFSKKSKTLNYVTNYITINPSRNTIQNNFSNNGNGSNYAIYDRKTICSFLDKKNIVKKEEVIESVEKAYDKKINNLYLEKERIISSF